MSKPKNIIDQANQSSLLPKSLKTQCAISKDKPNLKLARQANVANMRVGVQKPKQLVFLSISKYFEMLMQDKSEQEQAKRKRKEKLESELMDEGMLTCFCGKKYKTKSNFLIHIKDNHDFVVQSLAYLHNKQQFELLKIQVPRFQGQQKILIQNIRSSPFHSMLIPEELRNLISEKQKAQILQKADYLFTRNSQRLKQMNQDEPKKPYFFSENFMEDLRKIVIKHVEVFNRRVSVFLKNMSLKVVLYLFVFNLFSSIQATNKYKKYILNPWSTLIENGCEQFLKWVDCNYAKIFQKNGVYYQYMEVSEGEKFTQTQRVNKKQLFTQHFLKYLEKKEECKLRFKTLIFVFNHFDQWVNEKIQ